MAKPENIDYFRVQKDQRKLYVEYLKNMIDLSNASVLKDEAGSWLKEDIDEIVLNLKKVDFVDSMGLGILISIHKRVAEKNAKLTIKNPTENLKRLLNITGLNKVFFIE
jgi:anti-sigma B factor antagonist